MALRTRTVRRCVWGAEEFPRPTLALAGCCILAAMASGSTVAPLDLTITPDAEAPPSKASPSKLRDAYVRLVEPLSIATTPAQVLVGVGPRVEPFTIATTPAQVPVGEPDLHFCERGLDDGDNCPISTLSTINSSAAEIMAASVQALTFCCVAPVSIRQQCTSSPAWPAAHRFGCLERLLRSQTARPSPCFAHV